MSFCFIQLFPAFAPIPKGTSYGRTHRHSFQSQALPSVAVRTSSKFLPYGYASRKVQLILIIYIKKNIYKTISIFVIYKNNTILKCSLFASLGHTHRHFLRSPKEVGVCTLRARFAGGKATTNNKKQKIKFNHINYFLY